MKPTWQKLGLSGAFGLFAACSSVMGGESTFTWKSTAVSPASFSVTGNWTEVGDSTSSAPGNVLATPGNIDHAVIENVGTSPYLIYQTSTSLVGTIADIKLNSSNVTLAVGWNGTGAVNLRRFVLDGDFDILDGTFRVGRSGSTAAVAGTGTINNYDLIDIRAAGALAITFSNTGGIVNNVGATINIGVNSVLDTGYDVAQDNKQTVFVAGPFTNAGTLVLSTVSPGSSNATTTLESTHASKLLTNTGTIQILKGAGGVTTGTVLSGPYTGATSTGGNDQLANERNLLLKLDNQGTLQINNPVTRETRLGLAGAVAAEHTNSGTIEVGAGSILRLTAANTLNNSATGKITGTGKLQLIESNSTFKDNSNAGTFAPGIGGAGLLTVEIGSGQTLNNASTAKLSIELGGTAAGTQYDQLAVKGATIDAVTGWSIQADDATVNLDGTLEVALINGFAATISASDSFTVLTAGDINGYFDNATPVTGNVATLVLGSGDQFDVTYNDTSVVLSNFQSVPEPGVMSLLAVGSLGLLRRRRR
jgi:hypothetical protein